MTCQAGPDARHSPSSRRSAIGRAVRSSVVFLAEDDRAMRELVATVFRDAGYYVIEASDGGEMLQLIRDAIFDDIVKPDVIIMDVRMPLHTGLWLLGVIRRARWSVPVILMTAFGDRAVRQAAEAFDVAAFFDKPFDVDELRAAVAKLQLEFGSRSDAFWQWTTKGWRKATEG
jgi:two-component system response regulator (stage 0 sporulation protein F)